MKKLGTSESNIEVGQLDSFPKAVTLLQKLNRIEKTRLLKVINSEAFGFAKDLKVFYFQIRKRCRSDFYHASMHYDNLKKFFSTKKKNKNWVNYKLSELVKAIETTLNLEFQNNNTSLGAYITAVNHLNLRAVDFYEQSLDHLENELKGSNAFDTLAPFLGFQLELMRDVDLEKSLQRKQHRAYQNAFTALDRFYLTQQLILGIELSNRRDVLNQTTDLERVKEVISQPIFRTLMADRNVYLLTTLFELFNTDVREKGFYTAVERFWGEVKNDVNISNYMLCHYMGVLFIRCINVGYSQFRSYYLELMHLMRKAKMFERKGSITAANLKNVVKAALDEGDIELAEDFYNSLKEFVNDDINGMIQKLVRAMIFKANGQLSEMYLLLADIHQQVPLYEKLTLFRMKIEAQFESDMSLTKFKHADLLEVDNAVENLQKFLNRHEDDLPGDKIAAHKNFIEAVKKLRKGYGKKDELSSLKDWITQSSNLAGRNWLLAQITKK